MSRSGLTLAINNIKKNPVKKNKKNTLALISVVQGILEVLDVPGRPNTLSTNKRAVIAIKLCTAKETSKPPICGHQMDRLPVLITSAKSNQLS